MCLLRQLQSGTMRLTGAFMELKDKVQKLRKEKGRELTRPYYVSYDSTKNSTSSARGGQARARTQITIESQSGFIVNYPFIITIFSVVSRYTAKGSSNTTAVPSLSVVVVPVQASQISKPHSKSRQAPIALCCT